MPIDRTVSGNLCNISIDSIPLGRTRTTRFELQRLSDGLILESLQACLDNSANSAPAGFVDEGSSGDLETE